MSIESLTMFAFLLYIIMYCIVMGVCLEAKIVCPTVKLDGGKFTN